MSQKLLKSDGSIVELSAAELGKAIVVDASDPTSALQQLAELSADDTALLELPSSADGRALSVTGFIAASGSSVVPTLWVGGDILPDQVSLAFQCGADAVVVSKMNWQSRGEAGWVNSVKPPLTQLYRSEVWSAVTDISSARRRAEI